MKRNVAFLLVLLAGVGAILVSERREQNTHVSANAVLNVAADVQRDLTRAPMRLTRLSDEEGFASATSLQQTISRMGH